MNIEAIVDEYILENYPEGIWNKTPITKSFSCGQKVYTCYIQPIEKLCYIELKTTVGPLVVDIDIGELM